MKVNLIIAILGIIGILTCSFGAFLFTNERFNEFKFGWSNEENKVIKVTIRTRSFVLEGVYLILLGVIAIIIAITVTINKKSGRATV